MSNTKTKPAIELIPITASNSATFYPAFRGFHVNVGGTIYVDAPEEGTNVPLTVTAGVYYPYEITRVYATGTTAEVVGLR